MTYQNTLSRRRFLKLGCTGMGSTALLSSMVHLGAFSSAAAQTLTPSNDYRALVCVLLAGGNDSFNMLVPAEQGAYNEYASIRADLALPQNTLLPLTSADPDSQGFGLHPGMPELQQLFNTGKAAMLANVGTLVEPITLNAFESGAGKLPLGLFSHADQIDQWQTSLPDKRALTGWGGNHIIMGGDVNGGRVYGQYPRLFAGNTLDTGRGRLIPTTSVDEYFAELALWLGVDTSTLADVLPNIGRFYTPGSATTPLGFMRSG